MISTGFDYLNVHNPHIVYDKVSVVLAFTPSPTKFSLRENPEVLSLKNKHTISGFNYIYFVYTVQFKRKNKMKLMALMLQILLQKIKK